NGAAVAVGGAGPGNGIVEHALVVEAVLIGAAVLHFHGVQHHLQAAIHFAEAVFVGHPHVFEIGDIGAFVLQGMHRLDLDAGQIHGHHKDGEPLVLGDIRVGAGQQVNVVGEVAAGG